MAKDKELARPEDVDPGLFKRAWDWTTARAYPKARDLAARGLRDRGFGSLADGVAGPGARPAFVAFSVAYQQLSAVLDSLTHVYTGLVHAEDPDGGLTLRTPQVHVWKPTPYASARVSLKFVEKLVGVVSPMMGHLQDVLRDFPEWHNHLFQARGLHHSLHNIMEWHAAQVGSALKASDLPEPEQAPLGVANRKEHLASLTRAFEDVRSLLRLLNPLVSSGGPQDEPPSR